MATCAQIRNDIVFTNQQIEAAQARITQLQGIIAQKKNNTFDTGGAEARELEALQRQLNALIYDLKKLQRALKALYAELKFKICDVPPPCNNGTSTLSITLFDIKVERVAQDLTALNAKLAALQADKAAKEAQLKTLEQCQQLPEKNWSAKAVGGQDPLCIAWAPGYGTNALNNAEWVDFITTIKNKNAGPITACRTDDEIACMIRILMDKNNYELSSFLRACGGRAFYLEPKAIRALNACFNSFQKRIKKDKEDTIAAINAVALEIEKVQKAIADADPDSEVSRANQAETRLRIVKFLSEQSIVIKAATTVTAAVPDIPNLSLSRTVYDKNLVVYNAQAQTLSLDKTAALNMLGVGGCGVPNANWHHPVNITSSVELFWDGALRPLADIASTAVNIAQAPPGISVSVTAVKANPATLSTCIGPPQ